MIWRRFLESVAARPDGVAVSHAGGVVTYAALLAAAEAAAGRIPSPGGPRPWRAVIRQADPCALLVHALACWRQGFAAVVLRDSMTAAQVDEIAGWLRPAVMLDGPPPHVAASMPPPAPLGPRDEALVICTSGTTGTPKLVALPAESVCITAATIGASLGLGPADRVAVNTPLGYMYGLMGGCLASLWAGAAIRLFQPRDPLTQLQAALRREGITVVQGPPSLFRLFLAYWDGEPFPGVRMVTTGGEPLGADLAAGLTRAFPNARRLFLYGMTEAGPRISHLAFEEGGGTDACVGVPYDHFDWRIEPVAGSDAGRLVLRGPSMFLGYITRQGGYEGLDAEGFFHTNDLVTLDATGRLHFRGRLDRIFRSGGRLVNPEAVERVLASHPDVEDAVVSPEEHPLLGLVPVARVVLRPGAVFDQVALMAACAAAVEPHALPRRIVPGDAGGLAESGKRNRPAGPGPRS
ncbi:MAG: class I adenylate-forming enzyme family protein [Planctomycetota bacterium]